MHFAGIVSHFVYYPRKMHQKSAKIIQKSDEPLISKEVYTLLQTKILRKNKEAKNNHVRLENLVNLPNSSDFSTLKNKISPQARL